MTPIPRRTALVSLAILPWVACTSQRRSTAPALQPTPKQTITLKSSAFAANGIMPPKYTCDGENISPALSWDNPPEGTLSFALIVNDPDAPNRPFVHWVLYDLPPDLRQLPEAVPTQPLLLDGGTQGKSDFGYYGYGGACPPSGLHRYVFKLYAVDIVLDLAPGASSTELIAAMQGHILATGTLIGRYQRSQP